MNNAVYEKTMENLRNLNKCKACKKQKRLFKMDFQTNPHVTKIFDNDLVAICKNKVTSVLNKPAYIGIFILELVKY